MLVRMAIGRHWLQDDVGPATQGRIFDSTFSFMHVMERN